MAINKCSGNLKITVYFRNHWHLLVASGAPAPAGYSWVCCHPPIPCTSHPQIFFLLILQLWNPVKLTVLLRDAGWTLLPPALLFYPWVLWALPWGWSIALCRMPSSSWLTEIIDNIWNRNPGHPRIKSRQCILIFSPLFLHCCRLA